MTNLEVLLRSYASSPLSFEYIFDNVFDRSVRIVLDGRTYKRDFLFFQETQNLSRRWKINNIEMEMLDGENFHDTYRIEDFYDSNENYDDDASSSSSLLSLTSDLSSTFHAMARVKNGMIVKIKPMTGLAFIDLFESNTRYSMAKAEEPETQRKELEGEAISKIPKIGQCKRRDSGQSVIERLSSIIFPHLRCKGNSPKKIKLSAQ